MKLVGFGKRMSLASDATAELWKALMPRRHEIANRATSDFISMRVYDERVFGTNEQFLPEAEFEKWAAVEVTDHDDVPDGLEAYVIEGGTYAIFVHEGPASTFAGTMRRIFVDWLPASDYELDDREHFEVVPEGWRATDDRAREEIYIPLRMRAR